MKNMIAIYALLMVLSMIFVSCEHKELCYSHPHSTKVSVVFDWSQMPAAYTPGGMRVIFYPRSGARRLFAISWGKEVAVWKFHRAFMMWCASTTTRKG